MPQLLCCIVLLMFASPAVAQRPLMMTESAQTIGAHRLHTGIGGEYLAKREAPARDLPEKMVRIFVSNLNLGVADNVDFTLEWLGGYVVTYAGGRKGYDWGDPTLATKIRVWGDAESFPVIGIRSAVKLPSTSYLPLKLGNDQTDFFFQALVSGNFGAFELRLNGGFGIIGSPTSLGTQNDVFTYSAACVATLGEGSRAFLELAGLNGYFGDDSKLVARAGAAAKWFGVEWNVYGSVRVLGDNRDFATAFDLSENWSLGVFLSKEIEW